MTGTSTTSWRPLGRALRDYHCGATIAEIKIHSDLWETEVTPVEDFYRPDDQELPELELRALSLCRGRTLDLGAGAGRHALELQRRGHAVTALDVAAEAVEVMRDRGVKDARCGDLDAVRDEHFDTILLLMHGIGLVGDLAGLAHFLEHAAERLNVDGRIVCDSADLELVMGPKQQEILDRPDADGRYLGEVEFRLTYDSLEGDPYPWLFVDPRTLTSFAEEAGLRCQVVARGTRGAYLACIMRESSSTGGGMLRSRSRGEDPRIHTEKSIMNSFARSILLICVACLAVVSAAQEMAPPTENINPAVLKVNGETIYAAEISMVMQNIAGQLGGREEVPDNQELVQLATQRVVEQKLLAQEARRFGLKPDELRVAQMVQSAEQQSGGRETLATNLEGIGSSYEDLVAMVREMVLVRTLIAKQISPTIQVSDEEGAAFYTEHSDLFESGEQVHARHILFAAAEGADPATVSTALAKAEQVRKRALAGEDFATLASMMSEGPSAPKGGDLGFFGRDQMVGPFADAAFALEPGAVSEVVRTRFGFHVIKVEEHRPAATQPLEEAEPRVRSMMVQQKTGQTVADLLKTLSETATIEPLINEQPAAGGAPGVVTVPE